MSLKNYFKEQWREWAIVGALTCLVAYSNIVRSEEQTNNDPVDDRAVIGSSQNEFLFSQRSPDSFIDSCYEERFVAGQCRENDYISHQSTLEDRTLF